MEDRLTLFSRNASRREERSPPEIIFEKFLVRAGKGYTAAATNKWLTNMYRSHSWNFFVAGESPQLPDARSSFTRPGAQLARSYYTSSRLTLDEGESTTRCVMHRLRLNRGARRRSDGAVTSRKSSRWLFPIARSFPMITSRINTIPFAAVSRH